VNGSPKDDVDQAVRGSQELAIIMDLANYDKHGGHDRRGVHWSESWLGLILPLLDLGEQHRG
jgi:hypothetical protein